MIAMRVKIKEKKWMISMRILTERERERNQFFWDDNRICTKKKELYINTYKKLKLYIKNNLSI